MTNLGEIGQNNILLYIEGYIMPFVRTLKIESYGSERYTLVLTEHKHTRLRKRHIGGEL